MIKNTHFKNISILKTYPFLKHGMYDIVYTDMRVNPNLHLYRHALLNEKNIYIMKTSVLNE